MAGWGLGSLYRVDSVKPSPDCLKRACALWPHEYSMAGSGWGSLECVGSVKPLPLSGDHMTDGRHYCSMAARGWVSLDCVNSVKPPPNHLRGAHAWWPHDCVGSPVSWLCVDSKYTGTWPPCRTRTCGAVPGRACICTSGCRFCTCNWVQTLLCLYVLKNTREYSN